MIRVAFFPNTAQWDANPYLSLLRQALTRQGVGVVDVGNDFLSTRWLWVQRSRVDVLHLHWIQYHYLTALGKGSTVALVNFLRKLIWARLLGYRIVWTLHNVLPHERVPGNIDVFARRAMSLLSHSVLVFCEEGRRQLAERFGRRKHVYVAAHGRYLDAYSGRLDRTQVRVSLGLAPGDLAYLFFGGVRPHKNVELLLRTFAKVPGESSRLFVVGRSHGDEIRQRVTELAANDPRVTTVLEFVPDDRLRHYIEAADIVVLPFAEVMSSSSVILALSFGCPVIAPALGCLPEWLAEDCGFLYDPDDPEGLYQAIVSAQVADLQAMGWAAHGHMLTFSWDSVARETMKGYGVI